MCSVSSKLQHKLAKWPSATTIHSNEFTRYKCLPLRLHDIAQFLSSATASTSFGNCKAAALSCCASATHHSLVFTQHYPSTWGNLHKLGLLLRQKLQTISATERKAQIQIHSFRSWAKTAGWEQNLTNNKRSPFSIFLIDLPIGLLLEESLALVIKDWQYFLQQCLAHSRNSSCIWLGPPKGLFVPSSQGGLAERANALWETVRPEQVAFCLAPEEFYPHKSAQPMPSAQSCRQLRELLFLLDTKQLSYLLKGWIRPELKEKGLLYHPAFGQWAAWTWEDILELCHYLSQTTN